MAPATGASKSSDPVGLVAPVAATDAPRSDTAGDVGNPKGGDSVAVASRRGGCSGVGAATLSCVFEAGTTVMGDDTEAGTGVRVVL